MGAMKTPSGICLCLTGATLEEDLAFVARYRRDIDLLELRADFLRPEEAAKAAALPGKVDLPVILTVRRQREGGRFAGDERERIALLNRLSNGGFAFVDLEEDLDAPSLDRQLAEKKVGIIRSFHDRNGVPQDLLERFGRLARGPTEIPKAAVTPRGVADLLRVLETFQGFPQPRKVLLGMGDYGFPTRVLAPKLGTLFCYSSPPGDSAAPGQVDPQTLDELYRYHGVGGETEVYGVMGNPVMHSLSPRIHNAGFAALKRNAVYLPFLVDDLEPFLRVADLLGIRGLSVTIPHKERVLRVLGKKDPSVAATGACNTLHRGPSGAWDGTNTDAAGFLAPLVEVFGGRIPRGLGATVIGAGGASRAIVYALVGRGARVLVLNRTAERARQLAAAFNVQAAPLDESGLGLMSGFSDLIVQATNVGMSPRPEADPLPGYHFTGHEVAYDLVYVPETTVFLKRALSAGCRVIRGRQMLLAQAWEQFRIFTGSEYPSPARRELEQAESD